MLLLRSLDEMIRLAIKNSKFTGSMNFASFKNTVFLLVLLAISCGNQNHPQGSEAEPPINTPASTQEIRPGADQAEAYLPLLKDKRVGLVANQTSRLTAPNEHLVDFLLKEEIDLRRVFAPEHGFRGTADAGEAVADGIDQKTGLPVISLYGNNKKPTPEQLEGLDIVVFDIQDVGARFYTYISTLHYVMEACAQNRLPLLVLDRPNPNGHYVDGPVLNPAFRSFVGMHPVPVVHGMTVGEYARMINGEGWLEDGIQCALQVVPVKDYQRDSPYSVPVKPSPNLPNDRAINLYPSLCFFEGTVISAGRGTDHPFQLFGAPVLPAASYPFRFKPAPNAGAKYPKFSGELCRGLDLRDGARLERIHLEWLIAAYNAYPEKDRFFNDFFEKLAGSKILRSQIMEGMTAHQIRASWKEDLNAFLEVRRPYLLYN